MRASLIRERLHITRRCSRQCTRCPPCGVAVAPLYHKAATAYTAAKRGVRSVFVSLYILVGIRIVKKIFIALSASSILVGCGGGSNESTPECGENASCAPVSQLPDESIVGLWDRSGSEDGLEEILYTFIGSDGSYLVYDFQQDEFGTGENCSTLDTGRISRVAEGNRYTIEFTVTEFDSQGMSTSSATIFRQESNVEFRLEDGPVEEWVPVVEFGIEDLALCQ